MTTPYTHTHDTHNLVRVAWRHEPSPSSAYAGALCRGEQFRRQDGPQACPLPARACALMAATGPVRPVRSGCLAQAADGPPFEPQQRLQTVYETEPGPGNITAVSGSDGVSQSPVA